MGHSEVGLHDGLVVVLLMLVLRLDLVRYDLRHRQGEDASVDSQQKHDPVVSIRTVFDLPLLSLSVPLVTSTTGFSNFNMVDRADSLCFIDESTAFNSIIKHLLADSFFKRQLKLLNVLLDLLHSDAVIHAFVHGVRKLDDALHRDFKRYVTLKQILRRPMVLALSHQFLHSLLSKLGLSLLSDLLYYSLVNLSVFDSHLGSDMVYDLVPLPSILLSNSSESLALCFLSSLLLSLSL